LNHGGLSCENFFFVFLGRRRALIVIVTVTVTSVVEIFFYLLVHNVLIVHLKVVARIPLADHLLDLVRVH